MVGRGDGDGVDVVTHLVEHLAIVGEERHARMPLNRDGGVALEVDVAQRHDVAVERRLLSVALAFSAYANARDVELVGRRVALMGANEVGHRQGTRGHGSAFHKVAAAGCGRGIGFRGHGAHSGN